MSIKKLTLLHSNDLHGDMEEEKIDDSYVGGLSRLSGYVHKVRREEENVVYALAGDMFRGSIIDSEFKGLSTVELMNLVGPDVTCLGNHEVDYGVAHLLFLEKCATFPIVNANFYMRSPRRRLFNPEIILNVGGIKILFIGILTEAALLEVKKDTLFGTLVNIEEARDEVGRIINSYKTVDIDLTVLLTHIGFEEDKKLAAMLDPDWGVDIIIGGHTHTYITEPAVVNDILVVQAGTGSDQIGRFDLTIDMDKNCIKDYTWQCVPINDTTAPKDDVLEEVLGGYKDITDRKYNTILTRFRKPLTHPDRWAESELGNLFADILWKQLGTDFVLLGSGSIRKEVLGEAVTLQDLLEIFPFDGKVHAARIPGRVLKNAILYMCRDELFEKNHTEFYQFSSNLRLIYDYATKNIVSLALNGGPVDDNRIYTVAMQDFHYKNITKCLGVDTDSLENFERARIISTSDFDIIREYFETHASIDSRVDGRITILNAPKAD